MRKIALIVLIISIGAEIWLIAPSIIAHSLLKLGFPSTAAIFFNDPNWKGLALYKAGRWDEAAAMFKKSNSENYNLGNALAQNGQYDEAITAYERALVNQPDDEDAAFNKALLENTLQKISIPLNKKLSQPLHDSPATKIGGARDRPKTEENPGGGGAGLAAGSETQSKGAKGDSVGKDGASFSATGEDKDQSAAGAAGSTESLQQKENAQANFPDLLQERESRMRRRQQEAGIHPSAEWLQTLPDDPGQYLKLKILAEKARRLNANGGPIPEDD